MSYYTFKAFKRQTTQRAVSFGIEDYQSTNGFNPVYLKTLIITVTHIAMYDCNNQLHSLCSLT
jgi:hypothetical protein